METKKKKTLFFLCFLLEEKVVFERKREGLVDSDVSVLVVAIDIGADLDVFCLGDGSVRIVHGIYS